MTDIFASNEDVRRQAEHFATGLMSLGLVPGARVLVAAAQQWESVALIWACLGLKLVPIPVSPTVTQSELDATMASVGPAHTVLTTEAMFALAHSTRSTFDPVPRCRPIHLTSGTTGPPKGVWSGWWTAANAAAALEEERELWEFVSTDVNLVVSPLYHSAPLRFALNTVIAGGALVVPERFDVSTFDLDCAEFSPTTMFCVPTHLKRLLDAYECSPTQIVHDFRLVVHAGASCPTDLKRKAIDTWGANVVYEFYGSTEGQFTVCPSRDWLEHGEGVGFARNNRFIFVDENDQLWCVVPPWGTFEYVGDPEKTRSTWKETADGPAMTVGDLGKVDSDGWVHIVARRTDLIISGGVNLYPREIETVLERHPLVTDCAVIGVDDSDWGQKAIAVVVGTTTAEELKRFAAQHLSRVKLPTSYVFVNSIPHTATGKTQRQLLAAQVLGTPKG